MRHLLEGKNAIVTGTARGIGHKIVEVFAMHGANVFNFTAEVVPPMVEKLLEKAGIKQQEVDLWVFHQANKYMINYLRKLLDIDKDKFYLYMEKVGNTVSSTVPIALCEARKEGKLHGNVLLAGFGVGLSWAGTILKCKE